MSSLAPARGSSGPRWRRRALVGLGAFTLVVTGLLIAVLVFRPTGILGRKGYE